MTRILIVEDEASLSEPLAFLLGREGYELIVLCSFYGIRNYSSVCVTALKVQHYTCQLCDLLL
jgi:DNA-binding response OmpR family regulator